MSSSRTQSHQLSNGLYVSGRPDSLPGSNQPRAPPTTTTMASRAVIYTGGDVKTSGELGKMFDLSLGPSSIIPSQPNTPRAPSQPNSGSGPQQQHQQQQQRLPSRAPSQPNSGSGPQQQHQQQQQQRLPSRAPSQPNSGSGPQQQHQQQQRLYNSGSMPKKSSGQLPLPPTGLITSGQLDGPNNQNVGKMVYGAAAAVTSMGREGVKVSRGAMWVFGIVVLMGLLVGVFLMVAVKKPVILVVVAAVLGPVIVGLGWNYAWGKRAVLGYVVNFPDTELRGAVDGQFVKVSGVVTCGSIPLESSFQRVPRCVYVSTELYEYKGCGRKAANPKHRCLTWGSRHAEKYVADFYISDFHSGLRALVKSGYGAKVAPLVEPSTVVDINKEKGDPSPNFLQWLADRSLSKDDRIMRLKEGYVKEGSTVSVMGVVRRHENILMIVPPTEPISTGCQWLRCLLPMYIEGLILHCDDNQNSEVIPV